MVRGKVEVGRPVHWHARYVQSIRVGNEIFWSRCGVVHGHVVDGLLAGFDDVIERLPLVKLDVNLTGQNVRITDREPVVVTVVTALVGVRPSDVSAASKVV